MAGIPPRAHIQYPDPTPSANSPPKLLSRILCAGARHQEEAEGEIGVVSPETHGLLVIRLIVCGRFFLRWFDPLGDSAQRRGGRGLSRRRSENSSRDRRVF